MRLLAAVLCALALPVSVYGRSVAIEAVDSVSGDGVPYVAVYLTGTRGALSPMRTAERGLRFRTTECRGSNSRPWDMRKKVFR